jgi:hypothetical protein
MCIDDVRRLQQALHPAWLEEETHQDTNPGAGLFPCGRPFPKLVYVSHFERKPLQSMQGFLGLSQSAEELQESLW